MKPIASKSIKMIQYFKDHPDADVKKVAAKFKTALPVAYKTRKRAREELFNSMPEELANEATAEWSVGIDTETGNIIATHGGEEHKGDTIDEILGQRGTRYGSFEDNAKTTQMLQNVLHSQAGWYNLSFVQRESIEMIMHKISRLVNGDPTYLDTVVDISGYNELMLNHMRELREKQKVEK